MKKEPNKTQVARLTPDSQKRLVAYTTAAGLGALFAGQNADAQVTLSQAFPSYPVTILAGTSTNISFIPIDVDGDTVADFDLKFGDTGLPFATPHANQVCDLIGLTNSVSGPNHGLDSAAHNYLEAWLGTLTINSSTGFVPAYQPRLAIAYYYGAGLPFHLNDKFPVKSALGFSFISGVDSQTHFGYMDVMVNKTNEVIGGVTNGVLPSVTIYDIYYNATANAGISIPVSVSVSNILVDASSNVTINFTSNDGADPSKFTLETSPTLGPSATWTADPLSAIFLITAANPHAAKPLGVYQALTTAPGGAARFYRINHTSP